MVIKIVDLFVFSWDYIIETLPLIWLIVLCIFDYWDDFLLKRFYCKTLEKLGRNITDCRNGHPQLKCQNFTYINDPKDQCPVFVPIEKHLSNIEKDCPKIFHSSSHVQQNIFWKIVKDGFVRYHQATYFEIIFLQFFIVALLAKSSEVRTITFIIACGCFLVPYLVMTYFKQEPMPIFESRNMRLGVAGFIWFIIIGLFTIAI